MRYFYMLIIGLLTHGVFGQNDAICSVKITLDSSIVPSQLLTEVTGTPPFLYEWSNGRKTDRIGINFNGKYAVTITDATGCFNYDEYEYIQCSVSIVQDSTENGVELRAEVMGTPPFEYFWGDDTRMETTIPNGTGNYVVTISDATGCNAAVEIEYVDRDSSNFLIEGRIRNRGNNRDILFEGTAYLYQKLSAINYKLIDSIPFGDTGDWSPFSFGTVTRGSYIIRAVLNSDSDGYDEFLPTYYGPSTQWKNAQLVHIPYSGTRSADMLFYSKKVAEGDGYISGNLTEKDNLRAGITSRSNGDLSGYSILLLNEMGSPINSTVSNDLGDFSFQNLAFKKYKVLVEKIGYTSEETIVDLNLEDPSIKNLHFIINHTSKLIINEQVITSTLEKAKKTLKIFPNPSHTFLFIESVDEVIKIQFFDGIGREIKGSINNREIDISHLAEGVYFINIQTKNKQIFTKKIIKK